MWALPWAVVILFSGLIESHPLSAFLLVVVVLCVGQLVATRVLGKYPVPPHWDTPFTLLWIVLAMVLVWLVGWLRPPSRLSG